jgi:hypothetical protein
MSNIRRLPLPDRLTAEELHIVIHNASEKDKLWTLLKQVDFDQAMEVSIKPAGQGPIHDAESDGLAMVQGC